MAGEQMFDEHTDAVLFLTVEVSVFEEGKVFRSAYSFYFLEDVQGALAEFVEFFAGSFREHGADYINLRRVCNGTLVLREFATADLRKRFEPPETSPTERSRRQPKLK